MTKRINYADGTYLEHTTGFGVVVGARALCPDGKVRTMKRVAGWPDTYFSLPAAVNYRGKTITGYVTCQTKAGYDTVTDDDPAILKFFPYKYRKNANVFARNDAPNPHKD